MSIPLLSTSQIGRPAGIYSNFLTFKYGDPDYPVEVTMTKGEGTSARVEYYHATGLKEYIKEKRYEDIPWAIVSDSGFYLNMRRHMMDEYYLRFDSLSRYTYFEGEKIISKEIRKKRADKVASAIFFGPFTLLSPRNGSVLKRSYHPNDIGKHYFLNLDRGSIHVLNKKNLMEICEEKSIQMELDTAFIPDYNIPLLRYYLERIDKPEKEIPRPNVIQGTPENETDNEKD
ncbi:MAG: hypothetical protein HKN79_02710 [Flavobacteriales bacterium]|nr:hypothetical protein [Flavobacteriales bacterium]